MLDGTAKALIDPYLTRMGNGLARVGVSADMVTWAGFLVGAAAGMAIGLNYYLIGLVLLMFSRLADGLDGAVARATRKTDLGGYLDIVLDFAFYGLIPLGFVFADPEANAVAGAVLLFSFYVNGSSFLAYAIIAEKRDLETDQRGSKSLYFTTGLAEATETLAVFVACCLWPAAFPTIAWIFAVICFYTAASRIVLAIRMFG
ncbi:MAG TPA: CDP-alcohol phosphatidyltransferase family protein [Afifellaceae bacterium]|nr:CDP-alcohol phosphatidyltransferase family protein [Afifellaceae bacterium]